jgi:hypothetical protein
MVGATRRWWSSLPTGALLVVSTSWWMATPLESQVAAESQDAPPRPRYEVQRASGRIVVDGVLDEAAWESASPPATLQALWDQQTGPRQATAARVLWDDEYLYVGYEVEDVDITAQFLERDDPTYRDDAVEVFINPRPSQKALYYGIEMNARAVIYDYLLSDTQFFFKRYNIDGIQIATHLRGTLNVRGDQDSGWSLEVAIPWENFEVLGGPPSAGTVWEANFNRWDGVQPDRTMSIWSDPLQERAWPHVPERFGELVFLD